MTTREVVLEGGSPWGFRIQGGVDADSPLRISRVNSSGKAVLKGIREGDIITSINGQPTKNLTYTEAHGLIKNSEDPLRLELTVDTGSPRQRKRNRATLHETQSETLKSTSSTLYSRNTTKTIFQDENEYADPDQYLRRQSSIERHNHSKEHIDPPLSPDSTVSSLSSSSTLTETGKDQFHISSIQSSLTMADCANSKSRRKRTKNRRRRRQNGTNTNQLPITETDSNIPIEPENAEENEEHEYYKVDFPEPGGSKPKLKAKSKSLDDDDDTVKIQEVEESAEEDKHQCEAIVSEADSDWEETTDLRIPQNPVSLSTIAITIDEEPLQRAENFSAEEELSLRNFLEGINLVNAPGCQSSSSTLDSINKEKTRKRDALMKYFTPLAQNPRFLDIISEEGSDLSDRESSTLTRHLKQGTPERENIKESFEKSSPRVVRRNKLRRLQLKRNEEKAVLVCTKILDTPSIIEHVHTCTTENTEPEKVYLESSSDNGSSETSSDTGKSTPLEAEEEANENSRAESDTSSPLEEEEKEEEKEVLAHEEPKNELNNNYSSNNSEQFVEHSDIDLKCQIKSQDHTVVEESKHPKDKIELSEIVLEPVNIPKAEKEEMATSNDSITKENASKNNSLEKNEKVIEIHTQYVELTPPPTPVYSPKKKLSADNSADSDLEQYMKEVVVDTAKEITSVLCKLSQGYQTTFVVNQSIVPAPERPILQSISPHSPSLSSSTSRETSPSTVRYNPTSSIADVTSILTDLELAKEASQFKQPVSLRQICLEVLLKSQQGISLLKELSDVSFNLERLTRAGNETKEKLQSAASLKQMNFQDANNSNLISEVTEKLKRMMSSKKWAGIPFYNNPDLLPYLSPSQRTHLEKSERVENEPEIFFDLHSKLSEGVGPKNSNCSLDRRIEVTSFEKETVEKTSDISYSMNTSKTLPRDFKEMSSNPRLNVSNLDEWLDIARGNDRLQNQENIFNPKKQIETVTSREVSSKRRRTSLPDEIYQRQLQMILQKEKEIEQELENLLEEKRKLHVEMRNSLLQEDSSSGSTRDKERPKSFPQSPSETLRQKMYEEYMNQVAERAERKHHKMIKLTTPINKQECEKSQFESMHLPVLQEEFMKKVQERHGPLEKVEEETTHQEIREESTLETSSVLLIDGKSVKEATGLPKHLKEFVEITESTEANSDSSNGVWSPGQKQELTQAGFDKQRQQKKHDESIPSVWQPKSATSSPVAERKEYRPVSFETPKLGRKNKSEEFQVPYSSEKSTSRPHWQDSVTRGEVHHQTTSERRIPNSRSAPATGFNDLTINRLPKAQNPTVTLLQKAREGQLPKGANYLEANRDHYRIPHDFSSQGEIIHPRPSEYISESDSEVFRNSERRKIEGVGPVNSDGMPLSLRSEVRDNNQSKWYKKMYDTIHKQKPYKDEFVTVRYKPRRAQYPYISGYLSEPEPGAYDSDHMEYKYATLDRRRPQVNDKENFTTSTMPRNNQWRTTSASDYSLGSKLHPGRIENYIPGHSTISDQESKKWWDEVMDIFDGKVEEEKKPITKGYMSQALKESGYESDSTLVFRRKEDGSRLSPSEQREAYKIIQKGGDVPLHGLRKPAPERPKENSFRPVSPSYKDSLLELNIPRQEIFCYPVTVHPKRPDLFAEYKRSAPSTSTGIQRAPSPPKRRSSRNNTTLRLITTMKVEKEKLPICKRHEICFTTASDIDKSKVKFLRDKITCKLSPTRSKKSTKVTTVTSTKPSTNSKTTVTTKISSGEPVVKSTKKTKPEVCCSKESKPCKICSNKSEAKTSKRIVAKPVGTFGTEKRKILMNVPKFFEEKRTFRSDVAEETKSTATKITSSPNVHRKVSDLNGKMQVGEEGKKRFSRTRTPSPLYSRRSLVKSKSTPNVMPVKLSALNTSLESLRSPTLVRKERLLKNSTNSKKRGEGTPHSPNRDTLKKSKKEEINGKIANRKINNKSKSSKKSPEKSSKKETGQEVKPVKELKETTLEEIRERHKMVHSNSFFQHLFLRDVETPSPQLRRRPWLYEESIEKSRERPKDPAARAMKIYLNHTKPVSDSKFRNMDSRPRSVSPKSISFERKTFNSTESIDTVGRSISLPPKLIYFSQTSRPVSPVVERKHLEVHQPLHSPTVSRSPSRRKIDSMKQSHQTHCFKVSKSSSDGKIRSSTCDDARRNDFQNGVTYFARRSSKFKDLNEFYVTLEKLGELERIASINESKLRKRSEGEIVDFDRWQEVHHKERTEREMNYLSQKLKEKEKDEGFLFRPKDVKNYRWNREMDRGLRTREKSLDNIKGELEKLKLYDPSHIEKICLGRDTYKPLWRGSSVLNLANHMVAKRSKSEGRVPDGFKKFSSSDKLLTEGIGSRIWSSLSMDQVNTLKEQLSEIYNHNNKKQKASPEFSVYVPVEKSPPTHLSVRRNSDISKPVTIQKDSRVSEKLSETEKKRISQSLSNELMKRISKPSTEGEKFDAYKNIEKSIKPKKIKDKNIQVLQEKKPVISSQSTESDRRSSTSSKEGRNKYRSSESGSTDESTHTVIFTGNKEDVKKKVDYFEKALDSEEYIPTIHKPAESEFEDEKVDLPEPGKLVSSSSCQDLKELFGEKEIMRMASYPLSSTRKSHYTSPPLQLRTTTMSPCKLSVSETTSCDSLYRSRSLSPFFDQPHSSMRPGEVKRLKDKFEFFHNFLTNGSYKLRRCFSDSNLYKKSSRFFPALVNVDVDNLRKKYEYPVNAGRGRSRVKKGGVVSPVFLRAEDRFMPHINIISKIATLCSRKYDKAYSPTSEDLSEILSLKSGDVEKLREKFDKSSDISLLGKMFTSSPDIKELKDIAPYLTASWTAHRFPRTTENAISLVLPKEDVASTGTPTLRKVQKKSASPHRQPAKTSILKPHQRTRSVELPSGSLSKSKATSSSSQPDLNEVRYRSNWTSVNSKPSVTFKEPEPPVPPPKSHQGQSKRILEGSPRKYVENQVTIHYKTPVRQEIKDYFSEDELAHRQQEAMKKMYQEERRRKYLQELQDMHNRRHTDNFIPSQKSPISLNRYDDFDELVAPQHRIRPRSPEPRLVARALYNFVGMTPRELTFRKGDNIYVRRQIDKNWYEGELNAMVGLFPVNYVEIVPYENVKTTTRKPHEGQARAKYNFLAKTHLELSLAKGEMVIITRRVDNNWYEGKIGGRKGIFPASYVDVLIDPQEQSKENPKPVAAPAAHSLLLNGSSGRESMGSHTYTPNMQGSQDQGSVPSYYAKPVQVNYCNSYGGRNSAEPKNPVNQALHIDTQSADPVPFKALYKYLPQNDDELELMEGDTVYVLEKCDDGWFVGSNERTGAFGTFPGNYVDKV